ncbi:MAG: glycosyltransferase [Prevotella sp.]|nr:glycosyltransferase [Prevotella sp.]
MQLSIIVPVYNVEKFIRSCVESILKQGLDETCFEVIIVNDGTKDRSMEAIVDIIETHYNLHVITQENQGLSVARNTGLAQATGEYVMFVDSDDMLVPNSVQYLLDKALASKADLVVADFVRMTHEQIVLLPAQPVDQHDGNSQEMTGEELLMRKTVPGFNCVWKTLYRREFLNDNAIRFVPHIYFEDVPFTYQCYAKARKGLVVDWLLYIYQVGHASIITSSFNKKKGMDYSFCVAHTWKLSKEERFSPQLRQKIQDDAFDYFSMLLYSLTSSTSIKREEIKAVLNYLKELAPDLSFRNGMKQRTVSFLYRTTPSLYLNTRLFYARHVQEFIWSLKRKMKRLWRR